MGIAYLASVLKEKGHDVHVYNMAIYHYSISEMLELYKNHRFDVIGIGFICGYYSFKEVTKICDALNTIDRPRVILGGHGPSPAPAAEFFLKRLQAEFVVLGEAELSLPMLIDALEKGTSYTDLPGIAYRDSNTVYFNKRMDPVKNLDTIPFPAWELFPMESYIANHPEPTKPEDRFGNVFTSRGCPFVCNFCYRMERGIRMRSVDNVMEEIGTLIDRYKINYIQFQDELMMVSERRILELCDGIEKNKFKFEFQFNGRLDIVTRVMLKRLKEVGCRFINYGIESADQKVLDNMDKRLTLEQIHKGLQMTIDSGIDPGVNILFGNIGDTRETFKKGFELLKKYDTFCQNRTIKPVTPFPGTPLYDYAIDKGLLKDAEDFYIKHINSDSFTVNFSNVPDEEAYKLIFDANSFLIKEYHRRKGEAQIEGLRRLYFEKDANFRGVR